MAPLSKQNCLVFNDRRNSLYDSSASFRCDKTVPQSESSSRERSVAKGAVCRVTTHVRLAVERSRRSRASGLTAIAGLSCLPARRYASAGNSDQVSVCPSVTRRYCVKTKKDSGMISSPSVSPKTLVFRRQISSPNSKGFPPNGALKQGSDGKIQRFF